MKKTIVVLCLLVIMVGIVGCSPKQKVVERLQPIDAIKAYGEYNPFRVEDGHLYFTTLEEEGLSVYKINLKTKDVSKLFSEIQQYDSFVPLIDDDAIYVDSEGNLFYRKGNKETKIDTDISGMNSPNVLVAPDRSRLLYTKGTHENSSVYLYKLEEEKPQLIKGNIAEDAYNNFSFTTQWSNKRNYFVFNNQEVYNDKGEKISSIEATSVKWAPNDEYIAYIQIPENQQKNKVIIGDWSTFIGKKFLLHKVDSSDEEVIFETPNGLVDPIDSIQWNKSSDKVAVLEGKVKRGKEDFLEKIDYQGVHVYHIPKKELTKVEKLKYNFYQLILKDHIYGKRLGEQGALEVYPIGSNEGKTFKEPLMLNDKDLFVISTDGKAYLIDGVELIELDATGNSKILMKLPWKPYSMFYDEKNQGLIIINEAKEMYLYSL